MDKKLATLGAVLFISFLIFAVYIFFDGTPSTLIRASESTTPSVQTSLVFAWPLTVTADGVSESEITVYIRNKDNKGVAAKPVSIQTDLGVVKEKIVTSDSDGKAVFHLTSSEKGIAEIVSLVDNKKLLRKVSVKFE